MNTLDRRFRHKGPLYDGKNVDWSTHLTYSSDGHTAGPFIGSTHAFSKYETIDYFITPGYYKGKMNQNPCDHLRYRLLEASASGQALFHWFGENVILSYSNFRPNITPDNLLSRYNPTFGAIPLHEEAVKFLTESKTQLPTTMSAPNFLFELKDFGALLESFAKIPRHLFEYKSQIMKVATIKDHARFIRRETTNNGGRQTAKNTKKVIDKANDTYLESQFNWLPLVDDLKKATEMYDAVTKKLEWLKRTYKKPTRIHKFVDDFADHLSQDQAVMSFEASDNRVCYATPVGVDAKLHFSCDLMHDVNAHIAANAWERIFAGYGFNNPSKIVWDAIPFSFIIDWLTPVGTWLNNFAINPLKGDMLCSNYSWSSQYISEWELSLYFGPEGSGHGQWYPNTNGGYLGRLGIDRYIRNFGLPIIPENLSGIELSDYQQTLAASLLYGASH